MTASLDSGAGSPNKAQDVTAVIIQPMFFPWRGQFALYARADVVIVLDTVQWVKRHWYNRNYVVGPNGAQWITVPVVVESSRQTIAETEINHTDKRWQKRILNAISAGYSKTPHFERYYPEVERLISLPWSHIAPLSQASLEFGLRALGRQVLLIRASDLDVDHSDPTERLVALCRAAGANCYISGPAAKAYITDVSPFEDAGINLTYMEYNFGDYPQQREFREHPLSILDLLFNTGPDACSYIWPPNPGHDVGFSKPTP